MKTDCVQSDARRNKLKDHGDDMCVDKLDKSEAAATDLRIEFIDSWHKCWKAVHDDFAQAGRHERLLVDCDGWLSARQVLIVAYRGNELAGHILFRLVPRASVNQTPRPVVDASLDSFEVSPGFDDAAVRDVLLKEATRRARALRVGEMKGF